MNYYEILGVKTNCTQKELKEAYRKLVHEFHPDINPSGAERFKQISEAYGTLLDDEKRKQYNIINGIFEIEQEPDPTAQKTPDNNPQAKPKSYKYNTGFVPNLFKHIFENTNTERVMPINGKDINAEVTVSLSDVLHGVSKTVNIVNMELCPRCQGRRFINGNRCPVCNGTGQYSQHKKLTIKIPINIKNNGKLRIKGEGNKGHFGGKNGDLYLLVHIEGNSRVQYDGKNVIYHIPITPYEAVLGGKISIPTFDGFVELQLPKNTASGQKFTISSQGANKKASKNDIVVIVSIDIPKKLSNEEVKLYEKLRKLSNSNTRENLSDD